MVKLANFAKYIRLIVCLLMIAVTTDGLALIFPSRQRYNTSRRSSYPSRTIHNTSRSTSKTDTDKGKDKEKSKKSNSKKKNKEKDSETEQVGNATSSDEVATKEQTSQSQKAEDDVELVVTGDGATKEQATLSALRSALEQAYGTFVSSNTKILNDELVKDEIVSISTGIVKEYSYLSEKEVDAKHYVVLRAVITPQKLVSFVKQKGGSAELAGATFATNIKMRKLNESNFKDAMLNICEMQMEILPKCFDCGISVSEPKEINIRQEVEVLEKVGARGNYGVPFIFGFTYNKNAAAIQDLEQQKRKLCAHAFQDLIGLPYNDTVIDGLRKRLPSMTQEEKERYANEIYEHAKRNPSYATLETVMPLFLERIKIIDDLGEYWFKYNSEIINNSGGRSSVFSSISLQSNIDDPKMWLGSLNGNLSRSYNKNMDFGKDTFLDCNTKYASGYQSKVFNWDVVSPDKPAFDFRGIMIYTLSELEKITGINAVLK